MSLVTLTKAIPWTRREKCDFTVNTKENGKKGTGNIDREAPQEVLLKRIGKLGNIAAE